MRRDWKKMIFLLYVDHKKFFGLLFGILLLIWSSSLIWTLVILTQVKKKLSKRNFRPQGKRLYFDHNFFLEAYYKCKQQCSTFLEKFTIFKISFSSMFKYILFYTFNYLCPNDAYFSVIKLPIMPKMFCWLRPFLMWQNVTFSLYILKVC